MTIPQAQKRMNIAPGLNFDPQAVIGNRIWTRKHWLTSFWQRSILNAAGRE